MLDRMKNNSVNILDILENENLNFASANHLFPLNSISSIGLPKLNSNFESCLNFRFGFYELVHNKESLSPMIKFHYLLV